MTGGSREPIAEHERFMARALELAEQGRGGTSPNPMVGCVIVADDEVVGEGWHRAAGEPHAEILALEAAGDAARGATVYVSLEPCSHHGRTPPCTEALVAAGVQRVVVATLDPNPAVDGTGVAALREAGIDVVVGVLEDEAREQNEIFRTVQLEGRPFVLYKTAMTLDGKIATRTGQSRWITGERSRDRVQRWRDELDAIAVGVNTVILDDPRLTARTDGGRTPHKVVFDSVARTPVDAALFEPDDHGQAARVTIFVGEGAPAGRTTKLAARGADVVPLPGAKGRPDVAAALEHLRGIDISSVLLEGGGTLAWSFFEARAVDRVAWFVAPKLLGGKGASPLGGLGVSTMGDAIPLRDVRTEFLDGDVLVTAAVGTAAGSTASDDAAAAARSAASPLSDGAA